MTTPNIDNMNEMNTVNQGEENMSTENFDTLIENNDLDAIQAFNEEIASEITPSNTPISNAPTLEELENKYKHIDLKSHISGLRDRIVSEVTTYENSLAKREEIAKRLQNELTAVKQEDVAFFGNIGFDVEQLKNLNIERLKTDNEYLKQCSRLMDEFVLRSVDFIEGELNNN